jgi:polar amino acid transport system permease protein
MTTKANQRETKMKKLLLATAALMLGTSALAQDVVRLGTEGAYPPYNFINDAGEVAGFEREFGDEICKRAGLTCEWTTNEWDSIIPNLQSGNYDVIIAGMSITDEREFYLSFITVLVLLAITAPIALLFGFGGALASRSRFAPLRWFGKRIYTSMVRGVPDIVFFLFVPIALDQGSNGCAPRPIATPRSRSGRAMISWSAPPPSCRCATSPEWVHQSYGIFLAVLAFSIVFGAFAANVLYGAMNAVPRAQLETAEAYGMTPPPGEPPHPDPADVDLCGAGPVESVDDPDQGDAAAVPAGVEDIVYWARELGGAKTSAYRLSPSRLAAVLFPGHSGLLPADDLGLRTRASTASAAAVQAGQATPAGEAMRKAAT